MDAILYLKTKQRICNTHECKDCALNKFGDGNCGEFSNAERVVEIVGKWLKENPEEER